MKVISVAANSSSYEEAAAHHRDDAFLAVIPDDNCCCSIPALGPENTVCEDYNSVVLHFVCKPVCTALISRSLFSTFKLDHPSEVKGSFVVDQTNTQRMRILVTLGLILTDPCRNT